MAIQDKNLELTHDLQDAIHANDDAKMQELVAKLDASDAESTRLARNIGLENCGQSSS
jgi:L-amino acid N-acyltransferase YncA